MLGALIVVLSVPVIYSLLPVFSCSRPGVYNLRIFATWRSIKVLLYISLWPVSMASGDSRRRVLDERLIFFYFLVKYKRTEYSIQNIKYMSSTSLISFYCFF